MNHLKAIIVAAYDLYQTNWWRGELNPPEESRSLLGSSRDRFFSSMSFLKCASKFKAWLRPHPGCFIYIFPDMYEMQFEL